MKTLTQRRNGKSCGLLQMSKIVNLWTILPRKLWCTLNRIRTGHGRCAVTLHRWGAVESEMCDCNTNIPQTVEQIVLECSLRRFSGSMRELHCCEDDALDWLSNLNIIL